LLDTGDTEEFCDGAPGAEMILAGLIDQRATGDRDQQGEIFSCFRL